MPDKLATQRFKRTNLSKGAERESLLQDLPDCSRRTTVTPSCKAEGLRVLLQALRGFLGDLWEPFRLFLMTLLKPAVRKDIFYQAEISIPTFVLRPTHPTGRASRHVAPPFLQISGTS